jgi:hypothetical protein
VGTVGEPVQEDHEDRVHADTLTEKDRHALACFGRERLTLWLVSL